MITRRSVAFSTLAFAVAGCVAGGKPVTPMTVVPVEEQKKEIARLRDAGRIGYAEAARRQYAIQTANYTLSPGEHAFWQASITEAARVDSGEIPPAEYHQRVRIAYARHVGGRS